MTKIKTTDIDGLSGLFLLQTITLAAPAASILFTGMPASPPSDLVLVLMARGTNASSAVSLRGRFNGDAGLNYSSQQFAAFNTTFSATADANVDYFFAGSMPGASAPANSAGFLNITFPLYNTTTFNKVFYTENSFRQGTTVNDLFVRVASGSWASTAAITSFELFPVFGNFATGTVAKLYRRG